MLITFNTFVLDEKWCLPLSYVPVNSNRIIKTLRPQQCNDYESGIACARRCNA